MRAVAEASIAFQIEPQDVFISDAGASGEDGREARAWRFATIDPLVVTSPPRVRFRSSLVDHGCARCGCRIARERNLALNILTPA